MPDRYFSENPIDGPTVVLDGNEAHHLLHVMRAKPGLEITVFDGQGGEFAAEVTACQRSTVEVAVGPRQDIERELPFELTLAVALPKGDRQRWLIEKCTELGVTKIVPLQLARSTPARRASKGDGNKSTGSEKLTRYVIAASKQCGRNRLMEIAEPMNWPNFLDATTTGKRLIAHPGGHPLARAEHRKAESEPLCIAIGPEGGFTDDEVAQALDSGWNVVGLGERILRIETAALVLVSRLTGVSR